MSDPASRERFRKMAAKVGVGVSAFCVFTAGWVAMNSKDWGTILAVTALAAVAGLVAAGLSARTR
jgi:hypothetical protein